MHRFFLVSLLCYLICTSGMAQQSQSGAVPDAPSTGQQPQTQQAPGNTIQSSVAVFLTLQKKSVVFPDLATARGPLSSWDKCKLAANASVSLSTIGAALLGAGFGQARGAPGGYHGGFEGYGKRLGADMARSASYNVFGNCALASFTHEDPRFYVKNHLSFRETLKYAAVRLVITRNDAGQPVVNYSGLLGSLAGEALANTYYPRASNGVGDIFIRYSGDLAWRFGGHMLRQYWPVINKRIQLTPQQ